MKNLKLSAKLIGGFLVMAVMLLVGGLVGFSGITTVNGHLKTFVDVRVPQTYELSEINDARQNMMGMEQSLLVPEIFNNAGEKEKLQKSIEESWRRAEASWKQYDGLPRSDEANAIWNKLKPAWESWKMADQEFIGLIKQGNREEAQRVMSTRVEEFFNLSQKLLMDLSDINMKLAGESGAPG